MNDRVLGFDFQSDRGESGPPFYDGPLDLS